MSTIYIEFTIEVRFYIESNKMILYPQNIFHSFYIIRKNNNKCLSDYDDKNTLHISKENPDNNS